MAYADLTDVIDLYEGTLTSEQETWVENLLGLAERRLKAKIPTLIANIEAGDVDLAVVKDVLVSAVLRAVRNPSGVKQQAVGPFSYSNDTPTAGSGTNIWFRDDELELLAGPSPLAVGSTQMGLPRWRQP